MEVEYTCMLIVHGGERGREREREKGKEERVCFRWLR